MVVFIVFAKALDIMFIYFQITTKNGNPEQFYSTDDKVFI